MPAGGSRQRIGWIAEDRGYKTPCHIWQGYIGTNGYGHLGRTVRGVHHSQAHRWSYAHHVGDIPKGLDIEHLCHQRTCINPDHLRASTRSENINRTFDDRPRKEACPKGHPLAWPAPPGRRSPRCSICTNDVRRKRRAHQRETLGYITS